MSAGDRSGDDCREQAIKIKWKPTKALITPDQSFSDVSLTNIPEKKIRKNKNNSGKNNADFFTQKNYDVIFFKFINFDLKLIFLSCLYWNSI